MRSDKLFDTSLATSMGLVSQLFPFRSDPSGIVTMISSRGWAIILSRPHHQAIDENVLTLEKLLVLCLQFIKYFDTMVEEGWSGLQLYKISVVTLSRSGKERTSRGNVEVPVALDFFSLASFGFFPSLLTWGLSRAGIWAG